MTRQKKKHVDKQTYEKQKDMQSKQTDHDSLKLFETEESKRTWYAGRQDWCNNANASNLT